MDLEGVDGMLSRRRVCEREKVRLTVNILVM